MFTSLAFSHWQMCVWKQNDKINLTMRGPETKATRVNCPPETEFFSIVFKLVTFMPIRPATTLVDADATFPFANSKSVWLHSRAWEVPTFENADTFVERLVHDGLVAREPIVESALQSQLQPQSISLRSVQRRFTQVTGLTRGAIAQIERARYATVLLKQGVSILDTVEQAGYSDQPHLTRSLKLYTGQTPAQIALKAEPLSFLFKTLLAG